LRGHTPHREIKQQRRGLYRNFESGAGGNFPEILAEEWTHFVRFTRRGPVASRPAQYASKVAIPLPSDEAIRRIIGTSYSPEKTLNVIKMFAGTEDMFAATIGLVKAIFQTQGIDPKLREMIILRAATVLNAPYEWQANTQMARNTGLSSKEIDAAGSDGPVTGINLDYVLVVQRHDPHSVGRALHGRACQAEQNRSNQGGYNRGGRNSHDL
jgi:alkylhydroperoxidase/carboxymuconolactone decarboxylase family protein YurZ